MTRTPFRPMTISTIDIRPGVSVLAVLRHLNYKPWYALAEFVDNAVESFLKHRDSLQHVDGSTSKLRVRIHVDGAPPAQISIRDNAAGIAESEYSRAFRPAAIPPDRSGLAEFGMGMKSAACWFSPYWSVRTSALGEEVVREVRFDIDNIINDDISELSIREATAEAEHHYTEIVLTNVFHVPKGRTIGKLKEHLADIYRAFIRDDLLELYFNDELLTYTEPEILRAPYFKDPENGRDRLWRKDIAFDFGGALAVHGFAALRARASTAKAGLALFRRGRVIEGSGDEGYRPAHIFGRSNSYRYQRLFGELHLEGFDVSHTKDGFRWDENEQPFLELLREYLDSEDLPLLRQAEGYRVRVAPDRLESVATEAIASTADVMKEKLPEVLSTVSTEPLVEVPEIEAPEGSTLVSRQFDIMVRGIQWSINVELGNDPAEGAWLVVTDPAAPRGRPRRLGIRVSLAHPFMVRFGQGDKEGVEALLRVATAISLAEVLARDAGAKFAGTMRRNINEILREALAVP